MDEQRIREILDACLLTDLEFVQGPDFWKGFEDLLPPIETENPEKEACSVVQHSQISDGHMRR